MFHRTVFVLIISMCLGAMAAVVLSADALTLRSSEASEQPTHNQMPSTAPTSPQHNLTQSTGPKPAPVFDMPVNRLPRTIYPAR
ncbi:MAG: hypothetical protein ACF8OB_00620 [Phycisphaeraceae bacterium JB051]